MLHLKRICLLLIVIGTYGMLIPAEDRGWNVLGLVAVTWLLGNAAGWITRADWQFT